MYSSNLQFAGWVVVGTEEVQGCILLGVFHGFVQERCNSSALALELRLSCTNPAIFSYKKIEFSSHGNALEVLYTGDNTISGWFLKILFP